MKKMIRQIGKYKLKKALIISIENHEGKVNFVLAKALNIGASHDTKESAIADLIDNLDYELKGLETLIEKWKPYLNLEDL